MESWVQRWRLHVPRKSEAVLFHCFVAPEGRKVGSLKQRVRSHLARWEMNNCTPLWREARFELKTVKTIGFDVEKVHAVVARSTFRSQNAKHIMLGALSEVELLKKCMPLWREAHFEVKMLKTSHVWTTFGRWSIVLFCRRKGFCQKWAKLEGFCSSFKILGRRSDSRLFYLFAHLHLLSSDSFSSLIFFLLCFSSLLWFFPPLLFHLSIFSEVWLLNFLR